MAIIKNNPFGSITGKVGDLILKQNKQGKVIVSARPDRSKVKASKVQKYQRNKMKVAMQFLSPLSGLMKETYMPYRKDTSGFNAAKSYILKEALIQTEDGFVINYRKAMISFGDLRIPEGIQIRLEEDSAGFDIQLQWADNTHQALAYPDDTLLLVFHAPEEGRYIYYRDRGNRDTLSTSIRMENYWKTRELHIWMAFVSPEEQRASPSVYVGSIADMVVS